MCLDQCFSEPKKIGIYFDRPMAYTTTCCLNCLKTKIHCKSQQLGNKSGKGKKVPCLMSLNLWSDGISCNQRLFIYHTLPCCIFVQCNNICIYMKKTFCTVQHLHMKLFYTTSGVFYSTTHWQYGAIIN